MNEGQRAAYENLKTADCNYCKSRDFTELFRARDYRLLAINEALERDHVAPFCSNYDLHIVKCDNCGLVYLNPRLSEEGLQRLYEGFFREGICESEDYFLKEDLHRRVSQRHVSDISRHKRTGRLLDVGCATGVFLDMARGCGWEVYGVEYAERASAYARNAYGLKVFTGEIQDANFPEKFFDVVTFIDVLEHLQDPLGALRETNRVLKRNGLVVIRVPNLSSLRIRLVKENWKPFLNEHLYYFTPVTLDRMLKKAGFGILKIRSTDFGSLLQVFRVKKLRAMLKRAISGGAKSTDSGESGENLLSATSLPQKVKNFLSDALVYLGAPFKRSDYMTVYALKEE